MKRFWIILAVIIVGLVAIFVLTKPKNAPNTKFEGNAGQMQADDHVRNRGDNKKVTLIEYGDFQCPSCGAFYPIIKQLESQFNGQINFVFREFPLISLHPNALAAARAAEAAGLQGKFFEMHDKLYETQTSWGEVATNQQALFESYAKELNLNMAKFKQDYASQAVSDKIAKDQSSAGQFNVNATPTFILNGQKIKDNPQTIDAFQKLLNDAIKKAGGTPVDTTTPVTGSTPTDQ